MIKGFEITFQPLFFNDDCNLKGTGVIFTEGGLF